MLGKLKSPLKNRSGATSIEYGMIAALISIAALAALTSISVSLQDIYNLIVGAFS